MQAIRVAVDVPHGCLDALMPQQFRHVGDVDARIDSPRCRRVTQPMGRGVHDSRPDIIRLSVFRRRRQCVLHEAVERGAGYWFC